MVWNGKRTAVFHVINGTLLPPLLLTNVIKQLTTKGGSTHWKQSLKAGSLNQSGIFISTSDRLTAWGRHWIGPIILHTLRNINGDKNADLCPHEHKHTRTHTCNTDSHGEHPPNTNELEQYYHCFIVSLSHTHTHHILNIQRSGF